MLISQSRAFDSLAGSDPPQAAEPQSAALSDTAAPNKRTKAAADFEAVFLKEMIEAMLPKVENGSFGAGTAGNYFRSLLADKMADAMSGHGGLGIAAAIAKLSSSGPKGAAP